MYILHSIDCMHSIENFVIRAIIIELNLKKKTDFLWSVSRHENDSKGIDRSAKPVVLEAVSERNVKPWRDSYFDLFLDFDFMLHHRFFKVIIAVTWQGSP